MPLGFTSKLDHVLDSRIFLTFKYVLCTFKYGDFRFDNKFVVSYKLKELILKDLFTVELDFVSFTDLRTHASNWKEGMKRALI